MSSSLRRGGIGQMPGRASIQAGLFCLITAGCVKEPPPALLTLIDPEHMAMQDSELLPDSTKAAIRSYLSRVEDSVWIDPAIPEMEQLLGSCRGMTALINDEALPDDGRTHTVLIDVPGVGLTEFKLTRVRGATTGIPTYTGEAKDGEISILLHRDSVVAGRISTAAAVFNFRSGRYGLINIEPADTTGALPELHLVR